MFAASAANRNGNERMGSGSSEACVQFSVPRNMWELWINHSPGFILILPWVPYTITALALFLVGTWNRCGGFPAWLDAISLTDFPLNPIHTTGVRMTSPAKSYYHLSLLISFHLIWSELRMGFISELTWTSCKWRREYVMYDWGCQKWENTSHNGN